MSASFALNPNQDPIAASAVQKEVDPSERILWAGRSRRGFILRPFDWFILPFLFVWAAMILAFIAQDLASPHPDFVEAGLFIPLVLFAVALFGGHIVFDAWARKHTFYGLTDESVVFVYDYLRRSVRVLRLRTLHEIAFTERRGGHGSISFGSVYPWYYFGPWALNSSRNAPAAFENIDNARSVYGAILAAQRTLEMPSQRGS